MHRRALTLLFTLISLSMCAVAGYAAISGGRAWVIALAAAGIAAWMADLARKAWPR